MITGIKRSGWGVVIIPTVILAFIVFVAYLVGGLVLVGQSLKNYVLGFITGIPLLIILSKKARSKAISIFKRK